MKIKEISPQLAGTLDRRGVSGKNLEPVFRAAVECGGLRERDFVRAEGSSYNPRPARVAWMVMEYCGILNVEAISAGMLAAVEEVPVERFGDLPAGVSGLLAASGTAVEDWSRGLPGVEAVCIRLVVLLDRARHIHLAPKAVQDEVAPMLKHTIEKALAELKHPAPEYACTERILHLLRAWCSRR